jgi:predicted SAM-dependent methyltransferase
MVMRMMFGGQEDMYDYHYVGFNEHLLTSLLLQSGFCDVKRVETFNLFNDSSSMQYKGSYISLNIIARKCGD